MPGGFLSDMEPLPPIPQMPPEEKGGELPEKKREAGVEQGRESIEHAGTGEAGANVEDHIGDVGVGSGAPQTSVVLEKDEYQVRIEQVLDQNMESVIADLTPAKQEEFQRLKVETAGKIREMIEDVKVHFVAILVLIQKWLMMVPRVSKFFLEQESKIKTDNIKRIADELRAKRVA